MTGPAKAVLGGTFNPPHLAHLLVAQAVREALDLERVVLVPTAVHAFKGEAAATPRQRAEMTELAAAGDPGLEVDRLEVRRGGPSYTVDTLRELRAREPDTRWHLVLGSDNLAELSEWREAERLPELATLVVVTRGEADPGEGPWRAVRVPALEISSTAIRARVAAGRSIRYWVPPAVEAYVRAHGLYRAVPEGGPAPSPGEPG